jgi:polar amino acid transport system substrate-binding protein
MVKFSFWMLILVLIIAAGDVALARERLRAMVSTAMAMPLSNFDEGRLVGGVIYDLLQKLGQVTDAEVEFLPYPRKRLEWAASEGKVDLMCHMSPQWVDHPDAYAWSGLIYEHKEVIFGRKGVPEVKRIQDLPRGTRIGAVLWYAYPTINDFFKRGELVRDNVLDEYRILRKASMGRNDYGIVSLITFNWYRRSNPQHRIADWYSVIASYPIHCLIPKKGAWRPEVLTGALHQLKKSGEIDRILQSYQ